MAGATIDWDAEAALLLVDLACRVEQTRRCLRLSNRTPASVRR